MNENEKFILDLYQAISNKRATRALGELLAMHRAKLQRKALEQQKYRKDPRLEELADKAAWRALDQNLSLGTRQTLWTLARDLDRLATGKSQRPAALPQFRTADATPGGMK